MSYRVKDKNTAVALQAHLRLLGLVTSRVGHAGFDGVHLIEPKEYPMWREVCDAFVAGRASVVN